MPATRIAALTAAAALTLPLGGCGWTFHQAKARTMMTRQVEHVPGSALEIRTRNGRVEVVAAPEETGVSVEARLTAAGDTQEEAEARLAKITLDVRRGPEGNLVIAPAFPGPKRGGDGASLKVRLPGADGVTIGTSNGAVLARGLAGRIVIDTSNGSVVLTDHEGPAEIDTSNGSVRVEGLAGSLVADTSNGSMSLDDIQGSVQADTSNGSIVISLAPEQDGPVNLDTSNGSITARVGPAFAGTVRLSTSNGSISVIDPGGHIRSQRLTRSSGRLVVGEGGEASVLDTSNGPIVFAIEG